MVREVRPPRTLLIYALFALSGCAGLIYQSIWTRYLGLFLGHAAYAQSLVLTIFMGGMALGAWWVGAQCSAWQNLLRKYAWVELWIGLAAAVFHPVYLAATQFAYDHGFPALAGTSAGAAFKWSLAAALILPQSVLLGATFPLMSNALMRRLPTRSGAILGGLYFTNSIGAAAGALIATFVLVPAVGLPGAMATGALLNLTVAVGAFALARGDEPKPAGTSAMSGSAGSLRPWLLLAAFVTGATSFAYEIGWVRMLSLVFGSTVHAFELMLAAFIGGLACGAAWIRRRLDAYPSPVRVGGHVQIAMGVAALLSLVLYDHCFDGVAWALRVLPKTDAGYALFNGVTAVGAIAMMFPTAFFAGMTLPLFTLALIRDGGGEASVGRIYAANTIGAIVGIAATVHFLIPASGLKSAMIVAAAGDLALGLALLWRVTGTKPIRTLAVATTVCLTALGAAVVFARFDPMAMARGVYRNGVARFDKSNAQVVFYRDGKTASVSVMQGNDGTLLIATNGKTDASIQMKSGEPATLDELTARLAALLPLATHPDPVNAAVIGFGSGLTTHALLGDPRLRQVDTIEIEPAMVDGAKAFGASVTRAFHDSRSLVHFDDAKAWFAANPERYDIIISEPSNPWVAGVEGLFSTEFYRFVPRHLKADGLFVQWMQTYEIDDELVAMIGRSLATVFSDFRVYLANDTDVIIVATSSGSLPPMNDRIFGVPALSTELKSARIEGPEVLALRQVGDRRSLLPLFNLLSLRTNSDFYPVLSFEAPRARFVRTRAIALIGIATSDLPLRELLGRLAPAIPGHFHADAAYLPSQVSEQAAMIVAALANNGKAPTDTRVSSYVAMLLAGLPGCGAEGDMARLDVLQQFAARTIPFLDAEHLEHIWDDTGWVGCSRATDALRQMLATIAALARRDLPSAEAGAVAMLQAHRDVLSDVSREWLLRVAMLSALVQNRNTEVATLSTTIGRDVKSDGWNGIQRDYLLAVAASRQAAPIAAPTTP